MEVRPKPKLAIDVGGVLIEKKEKSGPDTNFDIDNVQWMPGAINAVKLLSQHYDIYILSFCGKKTEQETREALRKEILHYVPESKWIFTREPEYKILRMKKYGIHVLIDDTWQNISWVIQTGFNGIHYGSPRFPSWDSIVSYLIEQKNVNALQ